MKEESRDGEAPRFADMVQLNAFFSESPATEIDSLIDLGASWAIWHIYPDSCASTGIHSV